MSPAAIRLRRVEAADVEILEAEYASADVAGDLAWFGFSDAGRVRKRVESGETLRRDQGMLAIVDDEDTVVGAVTWIKVFHGPPPNGDCWNMGIWVAPEHRGKGYGAESQRLAAEYLFQHTLYERVEASTETGNIPEQRALERAGFTREGVIRRGCFRGGEWRDMVLYSKVRGEQ
ncbi:MAG TPA: GNAT family protein [Mycobacteriales bacterium]|nr:GNAT family protein [Mycobacteriales bacterium]